MDRPCRFQFILYITKGSAPSVRAEENLRRICGTRISVPCHIEIINAASSEADPSKHILATPTLIWDSGLSRGRILGDLSNEKAFLSVIGIPAGDL